MLLVDPSPTVEGAIEQVGEVFNLEVATCRLQKGDVQKVQSLIRMLENPDLSLPVVAGSRAAWKVLRPVNVWSMTTTFVHGEGIFPESHFASERGRPPASISGTDAAYTDYPVVPACTLDHASLYDLMAAGGNRVSNLLGTLLYWEAVDDYPRERYKANLKRAALRWLTPERHELRVSGGETKGSHAAHDFHAALRLIHGAVLAGWLLQEKAQDAYLETCNAAKDLLDDASEVWGDPNFFSVSEDFRGQRNRKLDDAFATLLLIDDQDFWESALGSIWEDFGFRTVQAAHPDELEEIREKSLRKEAPVRTVILDLKLGRDIPHGGVFQETLREIFPGVPVIALSVEDIFSQAALLKQRRLFCYLNKRTLTEERGYRDEITAFCQQRDAVLLASFASVVQDMRRLWQVLRRKVPAFQSKADAGIHTLDGYMQAAFDKLVDACRREFHARWQDADYPRGLACRQVIRSFGLVNDKWCECSFGLVGESWGDGLRLPGSQRFAPRQYYHWPHSAYHHTNTVLRNEASHAKVPDDCFRWLDVWIMALAMVLKMEGPLREGAPEEVDSLLKEVVRALRPLLRLSGRLGRGEMAEGNDVEGRVHDVTSASAEVGNRLRDQFDEDDAVGRKKYPGGREFLEGNASIPEELRVGVQPYVLRERRQSALLYEIASQNLRKRRAAQLKADLLVLEMVLARMQPIVDRDAKLQ